MELPASYCWNVVNIPFEVVAPGSVTLHYLHSDDRISVDFYVSLVYVQFSILDVRSFSDSASRTLPESRFQTNANFHLAKGCTKNNFKVKTTLKNHSNLAAQRFPKL